MSPTGLSNIAGEAGQLAELPEGAGRLFQKIRDHVATNQGAGQVFERLTKQFLIEDPLFSKRFSKVWLWSEWPGQKRDHDDGIDLVAQESDGGVCAIQCKFYGEDKYIDRKAIDSFLVSSARKPFTSRIFISTTERWSSNAEKILGDQQPPVQRIGIAEFEESPFDWSRYEPDHPEQLFRHSKKEIRDHQREAVDDVKAGFVSHDRGKLIMACGTGKTFTALSLAEETVRPGGVVLFCVPSLSLLSQSLRAWSADARRPIYALAVCSDAQSTKSDEDIHIYDLSLPATTRPEQIAEHLAWARAEAANEKNALIVVFSTYQSLERVAGAQDIGAPIFDLAIADEAHRTTGAFDAGEGYTGFTLIHDATRLKAKKRLYMTATPRLYTPRAKEKASSTNVVLCSMDDETIYGPEFHRLNFGRAVERDLLSDYRVVVLMVDEAFTNEAAHDVLTDEESPIKLEDAARLMGCWRGLSKRSVHEEDFAFDPVPMRRAVAFSTRIAYSKRLERALPALVENAREVGIDGVSVGVRHVDGTMGAIERDQALSWLREDPEDQSCRVLTNARCLSEGVDVPALDAVMFLNPRRSQVDVVQGVGRVMRKSEGKKYGYVIVPVPVSAGADPETALDSDNGYEVVWQVLQALRAHDDRLDAEINKLDLQKSRSGRISVIGVGGERESRGDRLATQELDLRWQGLEDKVYARVVKHCGKSSYIEDWAGDVARIAAAHITRIKTAIDKNEDLHAAFDRFVESLRQSLNPSVSEDEAIEMLAEHLITTPVFEALFGDSEFTAKNPVSEAMAEVLVALHEQEAIETERAELSGFYRDVRIRAEGIDNLEGQQRMIKQLYEVFFQRAFPRAAERLGIVYTPVELVDFVLKSADHILRTEFGAHLGANDVHVLDPFTGTGTFIARLLGLLDPSDLTSCYENLLHANEIVLLAYYIAAINIEQTYHALRGPGPYSPFPGVVLADTFQMGEATSEMLPEYLRPNSERARRQQALDITVIVGNPPYSVGQGSQNDNNKNLGYAKLDEKIRNTYAAKSSAGLKRNLYDSYIRAFRWASDRIGERGVISFVTNGAFIDAGSADGFRKTIAGEFSAIYCLNLRGNQRTSGETSRREGGKVFGSGSRTPVAITVLVKNPEHTGEAVIHYHDIGDYLSREEKLSKVTTFADISAVPWQEVTPNAAGDWINQRSELFEAFQPLGDKKVTTTQPVFDTYSLGVVTNRDAWAYNFSREELLSNMSRTIDAYNSERDRFQKSATTESVDGFVDTDPTKVSWTVNLKSDLRRNKPSVVDPTKAVRSMYRPFCKEWLYFDRRWNERVYLQPSLFPTPEHENRVIAVSGLGTRSQFSAIMTDSVPCLHLADASNGSQCFPRYHYTKVEDDGTNVSWVDPGSGYARHDAISKDTLDAYRERFGPDVSADDVFYYVYSVLHSPEYTSRFAAELGKMIPRIPMVEGFREFSEAGRRLADLHVRYEAVAPWELDGLLDAGADPKTLAVEKLRFAGSAREPDKSTIVVNPYVTLSGIPQDAYRYEVNGRSAIEWIIERYQAKVDKDSKIVNDPNTWSDNPRYIVELLARIVRVSIESVEIIDSLPPLGI
ncbi:MAG: DEAD/DEAH box helicase [Acidimicrobiales bacterium]